MLSRMSGIEKNPAKAVKNPRGVKIDRRHEQKLPFSDDENPRMYEMCDKWGTHEVRKYPRRLMVVWSKPTPLSELQTEMDRSRFR